MTHRAISFLGLSALLVHALWAQPKPTQPTSQFHYFQYVFTSLADPLQSPEKLERRQQMFADRMKLDPAELAALKGILTEFRSSLVALRQDGLALLRTKQPGAGLTVSDNEVLTGSLNSHRQRIMELGERLLHSLRPQTAHKLRLAIERQPY